MNNVVKAIGVIISGVIIGVLVLHYEYDFLQKQNSNAQPNSTNPLSELNEKDKVPKPSRDTVFIKTESPPIIRKDTIFIQPEQKPTPISKKEFVADKDGNIYPVLNINGVTWLGKNLNTIVNGSYCYKDNLENCNKYGRLYTLDGAIEACKSLGTGWRLSSDKEWKKLAEYYGGYRVELAVYAAEPLTEYGSSEDGYAALIEGGKSGFNAQLGGIKDLIGSRWVNSKGHYWTSDFTFGTRTYYVFSKGEEKSELLKHIYGASGYASCRCTKK